MRGNVKIYRTRFTSLLLAATMCTPLFWICIKVDTHRSIPPVLEGTALALLAFLPAVAIFLAAPFRKTQQCLLVVLAVILSFATVEGITPTYKLNDGGTELVFLAMHVVLTAA